VQALSAGWLIAGAAVLLALVAVFAVLIVRRRPGDTTETKGGEPPA